MQARSRKRRNSRGHRPVQIPEDTRKQVVLYSLVLLFLCSCSHYFRKGGELSQTSLSPMCYSGSGKGRITTEGGNKYLFGYESKLRRGKFTLGVSLPFQDDEVIQMNFANGGTPVLKGGFYKRLKRDLDSSSLNRLNRYMHHLSRFLTLVHEGAGPRQIAERGWVFTTGDGESTVTIPSDYGEEFVVEGFAIRSNYFSRQRISLWRGRGSNKVLVLSMELFVGECSNKSG